MIKNEQVKTRGTVIIERMKEIVSHERFISTSTRAHRHACTHARTHPPTHTHSHTHTHTPTPTHPQTPTHPHTHTHTHTHTYTQMFNKCFKTYALVQTLNRSKQVGYVKSYLFIGT